MHVWYAWLSDFAGEVEEWARFLSEDELARARRFVFDRDAERYMLRRAVLRRILSEYSGVGAGELRFGLEGNGKPVLVQGPGQPRLQFNASHSDGLAVYAVAHDLPVGIDIERVKAFPDWQTLVSEHFSDAEQAMVFGVAAEQQMAAFYRGWTRKEALLKAMGEGIGQGMRRVEVLLKRQQTPMIRSIDGKACLAAGWTLMDLPSFQGFMGALAVRAGPVEVQLDRWTAGAKAGKPVLR